MPATSDRYQYEPWVYSEFARILRGALVVGQTLRRVSLETDYGGIDAHFIIDQCTPLALRARFNRPAYAADCDVTFRTTEPRMIAAATYAPLAAFAWFNGQRCVAAKIVDVYRMAESITPSLNQRASNANGDGTAWISVAIEELHAAHALLRIYDGNVWCTPILGGELQLQRIISKYRNANNF